MYENMVTILFAIGFIIPGFIVISILNRVIPNQKKEYKYSILEFFIYSSLNAMIWAIPFYKIIIKNKAFFTHLEWTWLFICIIIFISPVTIALIILLINQKKLLEKFCQKLNIKLIEIEPSAWDFKFSNINSEWVIITLKNNERVAGFMGNSSCASSNIQERDIYISEVFTIDEEKNWHKVDGTDGIWIKSEEIRYIEFIKAERSETDGEKSK